MTDTNTETIALDHCTGSKMGYHDWARAELSCEVGEFKLMHPQATKHRTNRGLVVKIAVGDTYCKNCFVKFGQVMGK